MIPQISLMSTQKFKNDKIKFYGFLNFWLAIA